MIFVIFLIAGLLFGAGLTISGMVNPDKILDFLDVSAIPSGNWDPSLALVFAAALLPMLAAYRISERMTAPLSGDKFIIPNNETIDRRLIVGSAIFGVGWGLIGLCPGPAISGLAFGKFESILFVVAMFAGIALKRLQENAATRKSIIKAAG
jgi:uncharacterized membrane protein YedE/YeeE